MSKHSRPKQTQVRMYVNQRESLLLNAIRVYQESENPHLLGPVTRRFADLLPPYNGDRKREPGRHARRWDA